MGNLTKKTILAIVIGNALEWYDFVVYSFMTIYLMQLFFPHHDRATSLLATTATFGVAFLMRPLGAICFGLYADKMGRKAAMMGIIACMSSALLLLSLAPTYAEAGYMAPVVLVISRLLQGFSTGGEFGVSTAMLIELSPPDKKGFYTSWQMVGQNMSDVCGAMVGLLLTYFLSSAQILAWGWRLPFAMGLLIAPVGLYLRSQVKETLDVQHSALRIINFKQHGKLLLTGMGLGIAGTTAVYVKLYMPVYMNQYFHFSMPDSFMGLLLGTIPVLVFIPLFGWLADKMGIRKILLVSISLYLASIFPSFWCLTHYPYFITFALVQIIFGCFLGAYLGVYTAAMGLLFVKEIRSTSLAVISNLVVMVFGGFAQFIITWLIHFTGSLYAIAYYLCFAFVLTLIAALTFQEKGFSDEYSGMALAPYSI